MVLGLCMLEKKVLIFAFIYEECAVRKCKKIQNGFLYIVWEVDNHQSCCFMVTECTCRQHSESWGLLTASSLSSHSTGVGFLQELRFLLNLPTTWTSIIHWLVCECRNVSTGGAVHWSRSGCIPPYGQCFQDRLCIYCDLDQDRDYWRRMNDCSCLRS